LPAAEDKDSKLMSSSGLEASEQEMQDALQDLEDDNEVSGEDISLVGWYVSGLPKPWLWVWGIIEERDVPKGQNGLLICTRRQVELRPQHSEGRIASVSIQLAYKRHHHEHRVPLNELPTDKDLRRRLYNRNTQVLRVELHLHCMPEADNPLPCGFIQVYGCCV
jgi:hypothetical protein